MTTQSVDPPRLGEERPQIEDIVPSTNLDPQGKSAEAVNATSTPSVFFNTEPMREDQVQNAVKFLSHSKVRGSPVVYRRSFLERKGLTKEEIDEAFRRVPDPAPAISSGQADGQLTPSSNVQTQAPTKTLQPAIASVQPLMVSRFHWSHVLYIVGLMAVSGAGTAVLFKNVFVPRLKSWIRKVMFEEENECVKKINLKPSLTEEAAEAAKSAATAASDVARASLEILNFKTEERRSFDEFRNLLEVQIHEMKSMSNAIKQLSGENNTSVRSIPLQQGDHRFSATSSKYPNANGKVDFDSLSVQSSVQPHVESTVAPHPKSYMDIMAMVQRGETPSNIRDINDQPPNPYRPLPNPRLALRPKPWEVGHAQDTAVFPEFNNNQNGDDDVPWRRHKNVKIKEIETEEELGTVMYGTPSKPIQRAWVPPKPPSVAIPESAAAIRRPKSSVPNELTDDRTPDQISDEIDELQRITKIVEPSGKEINGDNSKSSLNEIVS